MSYLVLARKYRPQTFENIVEQKHVIQTLSNAISTNHIHHANLFSGPRGTGKTTIARILAKAMNCANGSTALPCNECSSCKEITAGHSIDVFEIDGASNNGVEQIRTLRDNIKYIPIKSKYKIYIIDEVHMLSNAAFNALLKTLEEPPSHILFMFATTEPNKIPVTILSRCQRHDLRIISIESITNHLKTICNKENKVISSETIDLIAREAEGSIRDSLSLLDQVIVCSDDKISYNQTLNILGVVDRKHIFDTSNAILNQDILLLINILEDIYNRGLDLKRLYHDLIEHFRNLIIIKIGNNNSNLVNYPDHDIDQMKKQVANTSILVLNQIFEILFKEEFYVKQSTNAKLALEMIFFKIIHTKPALPIDTLINKLDELKNNFSTEIETEKNINSLKPDVNTQKVNQLITSNNQDEISFQNSDNSFSTQNKIKKLDNNNELDNDLNNKPDIKPDIKLDNKDDTWAKITKAISVENPLLAVILGKSNLTNINDTSIEINIKSNNFEIDLLKKIKSINVIKQVCKNILNKEVDVLVNSELETENKKKNVNKLKTDALKHPIVEETLKIFNGKVEDIKIL